MTWIIIGLVAAMLLSSLYKLMPRGRTRHIQRLREQARQYGFTIERQAVGEADSSLQRCVGYRMALERCPLGHEFSCRLGENGWEWLHGSAATPGCDATLQRLPAGVKGIDRQSLSVLVHWLEPDDGAALVQLAEALEGLKEPLA